MTTPMICLLLFAPAAETGSFRYEPVADQASLPERYCLAAQSFDYRMELKYDLPASEVEIYRVTFPSPVTSATPENNTVHAEFYRPKGAGKFPGVIVLDITG